MFRSHSAPGPVVWNPRVREAFSHDSPVTWRQRGEGPRGQAGGWEVIGQPAAVGWAPRQDPPQPSCLPVQTVSAQNEVCPGHTCLPPLQISECLSLFFTPSFTLKVALFEYSHLKVNPKRGPQRREIRLWLLFRPNDLKASVQTGVSYWFLNSTYALPVKTFFKLLLIQMLSSVFEP